MPVPSLGLRALRGEDDLGGAGHLWPSAGPSLALPALRSLPWAVRHHLITGLAARTQAFGMVATTVDLASMVEVDEVHQQLPAGGAHKALRVPAGTQACSAGKHRDVSTSDLLPALPGDR